MKVDKYGFYVFDDEEPIDFESTDNYIGDMEETDSPCWWRDESYTDNYKEPVEEIA